MRHFKSGRKLGVSPDHRVALLRSLTLAIIERDSIQTSPSRAKELRWYAEHVVTLAKRGDVHSRRKIVSLLGSTMTHNGHNRVRSAIDRVYKELVPRFKDRPGGYTQILRLATNRAGDNAEQCLMRYIPVPDEKGGKKSGQKKTQAKEKSKKEKIEAKAEGKKKVEAAPAKGHEDKKRAKTEAKVEDKPTKKDKKDKEKA